MACSSRCFRRWSFIFWFSASMSKAICSTPRERGREGVREGGRRGREGGGGVARRHGHATRFLHGNATLAWRNAYATLVWRTA